MGFTPFASEELVKEYDVLYQSNPFRWDSAAHDKYIFEVVKQYLKSTRRRIPETMLDIGCGSGHTIEFFSRQWPGTKMVGIDLSPKAVEIGQKRVPLASWIASSLHKVTFPERFELVTAIGVLEHCPEPIQNFSKIRDLLSPRGIAFVEVPNCIAYPESDKAEGFRRLATTSHQWEWHLHRDSWEGRIRSAELSINLALKGPKPSMEYIWILTQGKEKIPLLPLLRIHGYGSVQRAMEFFRRFSPWVPGKVKELIKPLLPLT